MKKWVLILLMLLLTLPGYALITIEKKPGTGTLSGHLDDINANDLELDGKIADKVSDDAFTVDWAEVTDVAPSQAALYNYLVNFDADGDGLFSDEAWFPTIFDPAAPGEIGGTTPSTATFTELTVGIITSTPVDGENRLTFIDNTARSPAAGAEEIYSEGGLMKYSENGIEKSFVTIDDTAGDGDTTVTLSADKIAEYIAGVSGAAGYVAAPAYSDSTGTMGQYAWDSSYYYICTATNTWDRFAITRANWNNPMPTSILTETFEGTGYSSPTWTEYFEEAQGTIDEDYATALVGSQSLRMLSITYREVSTTKTVSIAGDFSISFVYRPITMGTNHSPIISFFNSATEIVRIEQRLDGYIGLLHGTESVYSTGPLAAATTYKIWVDYVKGSGVDGTMTYYVAEGAGATKPGTAERTLTGGTNQLDVTSIAIRGVNAIEYIIDDVVIE